MNRPRNGCSAQALGAQGRARQFISTHGLPKALLPNIVQLISLADGNVGARHLSRHFCSVAEVAADCQASAGAIASYTAPSRSGGFCGWRHCYTAMVFIRAVNERADGRADQVKVHMEEAFAALGQGVGASWLSWLRGCFAMTLGDSALERPRRDVVDLFHLLTSCACPPARGALGLRHTTHTLPVEANPLCEDFMWQVPGGNLPHDHLALNVVV